MFMYVCVLNFYLQAVLLQLTHRLLACIEAGDWDAYTAMCDPSLTCFEPEACGEHIAGLDFHKFYFDNRSAVRVRTWLIFLTPPSLFF